MPKITSKSERFGASRFILLVTLLFLVTFVSACGVEEPTDQALLHRTRCELVDWHITGLWVVNCPIAWVRVANYNNVPIKDIKLKYQTYDVTGNLLDTGSYVLEGEVAPGGVRNFIEQYLGLVSLHSERLSIQAVGVSPGL